MKRVITTLAIMLATLISAEAQEVKNIIYFIGDGMGLTSVSMMQLENNYEATIFDEADNIALQKTYSLDNRVTDSAASGTALVPSSCARSRRRSLCPIWVSTPRTTVV